MTIGTLDYSNPLARSITGAGTLNLAVSTGTPQVSISGGTLTISSNVSGTSGLTKTGAGTLSLTGSHPFSGPVSIVGGTFSGNTIANQGADSSFGRGNLAIANGATLQYTGTTAATDRPITLNTGGGAIEITDPAANLTLTGSMLGSGGLTKTGSGTVTLDGIKRLHRFEHHLRRHAERPLIANQNLNSSFGRGDFAISNGATLQYTGTTAFTDRPITLNSGGGTIEITDPATDLRLDGPMLGSGGLTKTGPGTLTLNGIKNYAGLNTISGGTLSGNSIAHQGVDSAFGRGDFAISNGATLHYSGAPSVTNRTIALTPEAGLSTSRQMPT